MIISMHGNWVITVKAKQAAYPQRFTVSGATSGNGTYNVAVGTPAVSVTGNQWSIAIMNDPGSGFRLSDTRIKFPVLSGSNFVFDIESNDAGNDEDFNDLILTCSSPATVSDYLLYGNVTLYSNGCIFNPCHRRWIVIDTYTKFLKALEIDKIREVITKLYPERIPPVLLSNLPDPPPGFSPIMINLVEDVQLPANLANVYRRIAADEPLKTSSKKAAAANQVSLLSNFRLEQQVNLSTNFSKENLIPYHRIGLGAIADSLKRICTTEPATYLTLNFVEYDRTISELAGGAYSGEGNKTNLGSAITDMNGNYIFRFTQSFEELVHEINEDVATGEDVVVQARPDIIVKITDSIHPSISLFESAPYFNVNQLRRIDICLPREKINPTSFCFNGNLIGSLGNVFIGGTQNTGASFSPASLNRDGYNNHLRSNGKITVHNSQALFSVDCACWAGAIDIKGCLFNLKRKKTDPVIANYTVRYRKPGASWQFVNETYIHPKFSKRYLPFYNGDLVGPFPRTLKVDGTSTPNIPSYINIQKEIFVDGIDWEFTNLDRYMQLHTNLYDANNPGTIYFLVEGYDDAGNLVPNARDLIALYVNNRRLDFGLGTVQFTSPLESYPCGLFKMSAAEINTPLQIQFKANDWWGFVDNYQLNIGKCPQLIEVDVTSPGIIAGTKSTGVLAAGSKATNNEAGNCPGYTGTIADFGTAGFVTMQLQPSVAEGGWLRPTEQFVVISLGLSAAMRKTNGYNTGIEGNYQSNHSFFIERK